MPKLKPIVQKDKVGVNRTANIKIRLTHERKRREIATPYYIEPEFMGSDGQVKKKCQNATTLNQALVKLQVEMYEILSAIGPDIIHMDVNTLANRLRREDANGIDFIKYTEEIRARLLKENRYSYATSFEVTITAYG